MDSQALAKKYVGICSRNQEVCNVKGHIILQNALFGPRNKLHLVGELDMFRVTYVHSINEFHITYRYIVYISRYIVYIYLRSYRYIYIYSI